MLRREKKKRPEAGEESSAATFVTTSEKARHGNYPQGGKEEGRGESRRGFGNPREKKDTGTKTKPSAGGRFKQEDPSPPSIEGSAAYVFHTF